MGDSLIEGEFPLGQQIGLPVDADGWERDLGSSPLPWSVRVPSAHDGFRATLRRHEIDDIVAVSWSAMPFTAFRGARQIADTVDDFIVVDIVDTGDLTLRQGRGEWVVGNGDAVAWTSRRPVRLEVREPVSARRLLIRRRVLDDVGCHLQFSEPTGDMLAVRLLRGYLDSLDSLLPMLSGEAAVAARNALLELVWGALQPRTPLDPLPLLPARRAAVDHYLDARLGRLDLTIEHVAAAHNISPRTLSRLFRETGGTFSGVLAAKRVARVREDLLTGNASVASLARRWGFADASHLNRRFREMHGMSPSEYRVIGRRGDSAPLPSRSG